MKPRVLAVFAAFGLSAAVMAQDDCSFDRAVVASQLARKAHKVPGARRVSATEYRWVEPGGRTIRISYGGCADLGAEVAVSASVQRHAALTQGDLVRAVARYWSVGDARALSAALASGKGAYSVGAGNRVVEFPSGASGSWPLGFTVTLGPDEVAVSWQEL